MKEVLSNFLIQWGPHYWTLFQEWLNNERCTITIIVQYISKNLFLLLKDSVTQGNYFCVSTCCSFLKRSLSFFITQRECFSIFDWVYLKSHREKCVKGDKNRQIFIYSLLGFKENLVRIKTAIMLLIKILSVNIFIFHCWAWKIDIWE
jgi:hypothetical protein